MDKFNWNGFSFNKNIIGAERENINGQSVYVIRAKDMDYEAYFKRLLYNFTAQFVGSVHKALDELVLNGKTLKEKSTRLQTLKFTAPSSMT